MLGRLGSLVLALALAPCALAQPAFTKAFSPSQIGPGSSATLTFTIDNSGSGAAVTSLAFTDDFPAGLVLADPALATTTCTGGGGRDATPVTSAPSGGGTVTFSGGAVGGGGTCVVQVAVTASSPGAYNNVSSALTSSAGTSGTAAATLTVSADRPGVSASYAPSPIVLGGRSTITYLLDNTASAADVFSFNVAHGLPAGVQVASPSNATTTCTGTTVTAPAGSTSISAQALFTGSVPLPAGASCGVSVDVVGTAIGTRANATGALTVQTALGSLNSGVAVAALDVLADALLLTKETIDDPVAPGGTATITYSVRNLNRGASASDVSFTDDLDAALAGLVATGLPASACGGTVSSADGGATLAFGGGALASGETCAFSVAVDVPAGAATGTYPGTTSVVSAVVEGQPALGSAATGDLVVAPVPLFTKTFVDDPVGPGATVTLRYSITNTSPTFGATDVAFTDSYSEVVGAGHTQTLPTAGFCGPGATAFIAPLDAGETGLSVTGASLDPGATCTFDVLLDVPPSQAGGAYPSTTSPITATVNGSAVTGGAASDVLDVLTSPTLSKAFPGGPVLPGASTTIDFTLRMDPEAGLGATDVSFTDDLDAALAGLVATGLPASACGGTVSSADGGATLAFGGGALASGETCAFSVAVDVPADATPGTYTNTTSPISATVDGATVTGGVASADLVVTALAFTTSFTDDPVAAGGSVTLEFTLTNGDPSASATGITFSDDLGAVLGGLASDSGTQTDVCGAGSSLSGSTTLTLTGGSLAPGASCTFSASLVVPSTATPGSYLNVTSDLVAFLDGAGFALPGATDVLEVSADAPPAFSKTFAPSSIPVGGTSVLSLVIDNSASAEAATDLDVTDVLPSGLVVASPADASTTCTGGTITAVTGTGTLAYAGGSVASGATCSVSVRVTSATAGTYVNTTGDLTSSLGNSGPATASLSVQIVAVSATKTDAIQGDDGDGLADPGETIRYTVVVSNDAGRASPALAFSDVPDATTTLVAGSVTTTQGTVTEGNGSGDSAVAIDVGPLAASASVTITLDVTVDGPIPDGVTEVCNQGTVTGTLAAVGTDDPDTAGTADATCLLVDPNEPPVADAGDDQTAECVGPDGAVVGLDGSGSTDPDGDALTYTWTGPFAEGGGTVTGVSPLVTLPVGEHTITLTVEDPSGETSTDEVVVTVADTTPPVLTVGADPLRLWPPNGKYRTVPLGDLDLTASDACDAGVSAAATVLAQVTSDEPENGSGDGNTVDDIVIAGSCQAVDLRSERAGNGDGRVYTLSLAVADDAGNVATADYEVYVPKNANQTAVAGPPVYTVTGCAAAGALAAAAAAGLGLPTTEVPTDYALDPAFPNPLSRTATVGFDVPEAGAVLVAVYDALGREVARLADGHVEAGHHQAWFVADGLPSGTYLVRMTTDAGFAQTRSLTVLR